MHGASILGCLAGLLLLVGCNGGSAPAGPDGEATAGISFGSDPITVPGRGSISRTAFRRFVSVRLAGRWLSFLALDRAMQAELGDGGEPDRALLGQMRGFVRDGNLLREWQPAPQGPWRSGKAELDLAWCLARLWKLRGDASEPPTPERLRELFTAEMELRQPETTGWGATCEGHTVADEEVYPSLLALLTPAQREALLREAVAQ